MRDLEFIPGSRGFPGFRQNDVAARCSEPPFLTHGGQDVGSYTNSLKIWMPAHTAEWQIGVATKSNGAVLTKQDRDNNALADKSAKTAAEAHRVKQAVRASILESVADVTDMAMWIARITLLANRYKLPDGTILRDSLALSALSRRRLGIKRKRNDPSEKPLDMQQRLAKCPRIAAILERVRVRCR